MPQKDGKWWVEGQEPTGSHLHLSSGISSAHYTNINLCSLSLSARSLFAGSFFFFFFFLIFFYLQVLAGCPHLDDQLEFNLSWREGDTFPSSMVLLTPVCPAPWHCALQILRTVLTVWGTLPIATCSTDVYWTELLRHQFAPGLIWNCSFIG